MGSLKTKSQPNEGVSVIKQKSIFVICLAFVFVCYTEYVNNDSAKPNPINKKGVRLIWYRFLVDDRILNNLN